MSFLDDLKNELQKSQAETQPEPVSAMEEKIQPYIKEELSYIRQEVMNAARTGNYKTANGKSIFTGTRTWHEGEHRHGTESLANFYPMLSQEAMLDREILSQSKVLVFGFHYEVRYSLSERGAQISRIFTEAMKKEGVIVAGPFFKDDKGNETALPYTAKGTVRYDFELEHHLSDYPKLYYTYRIEL